VDGRTAQSLRHLKEHRAFLQGHVARPGLETEERFRANPGQRVILKEQLGSGLLSSLQTQILLYYIADDCRLFALRWIDHGDPIDDFGDFRRSQWTSVRWLEETERDKGDEARGQDASQHRRFVLTINTIFARNRSMKLE
jgi:hypothetical protein